MVVVLTRKVKHAVLTAVCRTAPTLPSPARGGNMLRYRPGIRARSRPRFRPRRFRPGDSRAEAGSRPRPDCAVRYDRWRAPADHAAPLKPVAPTPPAESGTPPGRGRPRTPRVLEHPAGTASAPPRGVDAAASRRSPGLLPSGNLNRGPATLRGASLAAGARRTQQREQGPAAPAIRRLA